MHPFTIAASLLATSLLPTALAAPTARSVADQKLAVYWGQGPYQMRLAEFCNSTDNTIDIIPIGFVNKFPDETGDGVPGANFGNACGGYWTDPQTNKTTQMFSDCYQIAEDIPVCHAAGKKILLSLGGDSPNEAISSTSSADAFAKFLWGAFGPVDATFNGPRPFGANVIDGFDLDIESGNGLYFSELVNELRALAAADSTTILISGAPQCPIPDAHLADAISNSMFDYLFIQFYNNPGCSAGSGNINWDAWITWLNANSKNKAVKMFLGLPASVSAAPNAPGDYLSLTQAQTLIQSLACDSTHNTLYGGVMLWEATYSFNNQINGKPYAANIKDLMNGVTCASPGTTSTTTATTTTTTASTLSSTTSTTTTLTSSTTTTASTSLTPSTSSTSSSVSSSSSTSSVSPVSTSGFSSSTSSVSSSPSTSSISSTTISSSSTTTPSAYLTSTSTSSQSSSLSSTTTSSGAIGPITASTVSSSSTSSSSVSTTSSSTPTPVWEDWSTTTTTTSSAISIDPAATNSASSSTTTPSAFPWADWSATSSISSPSSTSTPTNQVGPLATSQADVYTTILTTSYIYICPTGLATTGFTITTTIPSSSSPAATTPAFPANAFTTTVTICTVCGPAPTAVTLTLPIPTTTAVSVQTVVPVASASVAAPAAAGGGAAGSPSASTAAAAVTSSSLSTSSIIPTIPKLTIIPAQNQTTATATTFSSSLSTNNVAPVMATASPYTKANPQSNATPFTGGAPAALKDELPGTVLSVAVCVIVAVVGLFI